MCVCDVCEELQLARGNCMVRVEIVESVGGELVVGCWWYVVVWSLAIVGRWVGGAVLKDETEANINKGYVCRGESRTL